MPYQEIQALGFPNSPRKLGLYEKPWACISWYGPCTQLVNSKYHLITFDLSINSLQLYKKLRYTLKFSNVIIKRVLKVMYLLNPSKFRLRSMLKASKNRENIKEKIDLCRNLIWSNSVIILTIPDIDQNLKPFAPHNGE